MKTPGGVSLQQYSHGDGDVATLLLGSCEGDGKGRLEPFHLVNKLDPELVMIDCRVKARVWTEIKNIIGTYVSKFEYKILCIFMYAFIHISISCFFFNMSFECFSPE